MVARAEVFLASQQDADTLSSMAAKYTVLDAATANSLRDENRDFALDVLVGLSEAPKSLSSRYFYDDEGSRLFQQIMELYEYYPTSCEREILETHAAEILAPFEGKPFNLVDLGAGDGAKTVVLLDELKRSGADVRYVPIDISEGAMKSCTEAVAKKVPGIEVAGVVSEYASGIEWLGTQDPDRSTLVLFLGSNLGNFDKPNARAFLRRMWNSLRPNDYVLVGFDLKKEIDMLLSAYNDNQGVTARFNLNVLTRINRELGGHFDIEKFRHFGTYDVYSGAMKSYLVSTEKQSVAVDSLRYTFEFEAWEPIFTEFSYKYLESDIEDLSTATGFAVADRFKDRRGYFVDALLKVEKG